MQRLTTTIEQAINSLDYTLKTVNSDTIKIMATKLDYNGIILETPKDKKKKKVGIPHVATSAKRAYRAVVHLHHSVSQELLREEIERMGHKIRNLWNSRHRVTGKPLPLF
jgi:tRNA G37 N-methylase Trm5